jgi:hypothetical protein
MDVLGDQAVTHDSMIRTPVRGQRLGRSAGLRNGAPEEGPLLYVRLRGSKQLD